MILIVTALGFFLLRFLFRIAGNLLMLSFVILLISDEVRIHPDAARAVWKAVIYGAEKVAEFERDQVSSIGQVVPMQHQGLANHSDRPAVGYY